MQKIICPHCQNDCYTKNNLCYSICPHCGNSLDKENSPIKDFIIEGFNLIENKNYQQLSILSNIIRVNFKSCFWGYCFSAIAETECDITKPIPRLSFQLNQNEIQDDLKARIYHGARNKYKAFTQGAYDSLCNFYKDTPGEKRGEWKKAKTSYDVKLSNINSCLNIVSYIEDKYLRDMEIYANNDKEIIIVHNFKLWKDYLLFAKEELLRYEESATAFIKEDYKNTPSPGNKPKYIMNLILGVLFSLILTIFSFELLFSLIDVNHQFTLNAVLSIASNTLYIFCFIIFMIGRKYFSNGKFITGLIMIALTCVGISLNIVNIFYDKFNIWFFIVNMIFCVVNILIAFRKVHKYMPHNTYSNGTYIGNFKALCNNDFDVKFIFSWKLFIGGNEIGAGSLEELIKYYE